MRIRDLLAAESIELNGSAAGKQDVLNQMVDLMAKSGKTTLNAKYKLSIKFPLIFWNPHFNISSIMEQ